MIARGLDSRFPLTARMWNDGGVRPGLPLLTSRRHIDLLRVAGATC
jgi:hypothetical protein